MEKSKKRQILIILIVTLVLVLILGGAYAFWTYSRTLDNQTLISGDIFLKYTEGDTINIKEAMPSVTYNPDDYFEFSVQGKNTYKKDVVFEIILDEGDEPTGEENKSRTERIKPELLKFRLVEVKDGKEEELIQEGNYDNLNKKRIWVDRVKSNTKEEIKYTYRLYMWISNDVKIGNMEGADYTAEVWNNNVFASVKVGVNGDFNEKELTEDYFILNAVNETGEPYDLKQPIQSNEDITLTLGSKREVTKFVVSKSEQYPIALMSLDSPTDYTASYNEATRAWESTITLDETGIYDYYAVYPQGQSKTHSFTLLFNPDRFVKVEKPTSALCKQNLIYNGELQDLVENTAPEGYTFEEYEQQKDANTYEITAKLKDTNKFKWADSTINDVTFSCTIEPKDIIITPRSGQKKEYNATEPTLTYDYTGNLANETPSFTGKLGREDGTDAGTYPINLGTLELVDKEPFKKDNYKLKLSEPIVNFEITKTTLTLKMSAKGANAIKNSTGQYTVESNAKGKFTISSESETYASVTSSGTSNSSKATFNITAKSTVGSTNIQILFTPTEGASNYTESTISETFPVNVISPGTASTVIKATLGNKAGVIGVTSNNEATTSSSSSIRDYRYSGLGVGNYVTFNDELWRIIGIVDGNVKIVRNEMLPTSAIPLEYTVGSKTFKIRYSYNSNDTRWDFYENNSNSDNNWADAGLMNWLNSKGTTDGYLKMLTSTAQNMVLSSTYKLGNVKADSIIKDLYTQERGSASCTPAGTYKTCNGGDIFPGNSSSWTGSIALMYPSDYGFSTESTFWDKSSSTTGNFLTSWLQVETDHRIGNSSGNYEWFLNPSANSPESVSTWKGYGGIDSPFPAFSNCVVRPALNLKSSVQITGGQGSQLSPYILSGN